MIASRRRPPAHWGENYRRRRSRRRRRRRCHRRRRVARVRRTAESSFSGRPGRAIVNPRPFGSRRIVRDSSPARCRCRSSCRPKSPSQFPRRIAEPRITVYLSPAETRRRSLFGHNRCRIFPRYHVHHHHHHHVHHHPRGLVHAFSYQAQGRGLAGRLAFLVSPRPASPRLASASAAAATCVILYRAAAAVATASSSSSSSPRLVAPRGTRSGTGKSRIIMSAAHTRCAPLR